MNDAWKQTLEYPGEQYRTMNVLEIIHPEDRHEAAVKLGRVLAGTDIGRIETSFITRSGRRIRVSGSPPASTTGGRSRRARSSAT